MTQTVQFEGHRGGRPCDVVVGFDFGTSCSKIVVRTPYEHGDRAYVVPFSTEGHKSCNSLLPSVVWLDEQGRASLVGRGPIRLRDIKFHLMQGKPVPMWGEKPGDPVDSRVAAVAFLALALQQTRRWFLQTQRALYGEFQLRWQLNVGLPAANYDDKLLCALYRQVSRAAWDLSVTDGPITIRDAAEALHRAEGESADGDGVVVEVIPEVAAEVVGYARSTMRDEGLHILVDVGASTLDVCAFILHEREGDDRYELLTADVHRLGTMALHQQRVWGVQQAVDVHVASLWEDCDPVNPIPEEPGAYLPEPKSITRSVTNMEDCYRKMCLRAMWNTIVDLKTKRDPRSSRWMEQLPLFLSGGGSMMQFYKDTIDRLSQEILRTYAPCGGLRSLTLGKPENLVGEISKFTYQRFAVAWGLSYPETDIGQITRPSDIQDVPPPVRRDWEGGFVSKDDV